MQTGKSEPTIDASSSPAAWRSALVALYSLAVGLLGLGALAQQLAAGDQALDWVSILVFTGLSLLIQRSSFHLGSPTVHSLAGVIDLAAVLALGPTAGAVVAALSGLIYLSLNALRHRRLSRRYLLEIPLFNAGLKASMALLSGAVFGALAQRLAGSAILAVCAVSLLWFVVDHVGWGLLDFFEGGLDRLRAFVRDAIPQALFIELLPLPAALIVALVYTYLGWAAFALVALSIVAVAVLTQRWADTRNELTQRVAELTTIDRVGLSIAQAQLDVDELCRLIYESASQVVDTTIFHLGLFDGDNYAIKLWMRNGQPTPQQTFRLTPGVGLVNWLRETGQPIRVRDFEREVDSLPARPAYVSDNPPRSALFVPLLAGDTVIGTLSVQSFRRNAYATSDLRVLSAMANQAAVAIQKAQLYAQERKRVKQLETIGQVASQVTAILDLEELFQQVVHLVRENFGYYHVALYTANRQRETVTFRASASAGERDVAFEVEWGEGLIGWVAAHAQAVNISDVENDTRYLCVAALEETRSELAVPLCLRSAADGDLAASGAASGAEGDELVGVLDVQSDRLDAFSADDLFILETLGSQVALAIHEARLYEAERQQAWFSTALLQVAEAMSHLSDMDAVLTTIVRLTPLLVGVDRCAILLWDQETETFIPAQAYGLSPELRETFDHLRFRPGSALALDLVRLDRRPLLVDAARDGWLLPDDLIETFDIHEMLLLPLLAQGEMQGAMLVDYAETAHSFSGRMIDMLTGIANQAATVVQSARLLRARQEEAYVSMALLQVAEVVSRSTDLDEILATIVRLTPMLVGVERCALFLWNPGAAAFVPVHTYGLGSELRAAVGQLRLTDRDFPIRELAAGAPHVTLAGTDIQFLAFHSGLKSPQPGSELGASSLLALPLVAKGELLGTMIVDPAGPEPRFTQRWMNILTGIAGQAAIAVENERLNREAAEQERMKQELTVAQRIQTSFLPECCPNLPGWELATIWRSARQVGGDFYDFFFLPPHSGEGDTGGRIGMVIADVADKGVPAALFMALARTLVRTMASDGRPPARAIARSNDLIITDARSDLFVTLFYTILQTDSGQIRYVNAGHIPPLLVHQADGAVEELRTDGIALGVLPDIDFEERAAHLEPGDTLVLYTDGVTEASNVDQEMFGRERLVEVVRSHRSQSAADLAQTIDDAVADFVGEAPQFDDFTLVVAKKRSG